ncbi:MAG TPA: hypothetical protein VFZ34_06220 [Blastocatellia bacterium]|nr:hypothetical protein [Blastocatellia bacterium]
MNQITDDTTAAKAKYEIEQALLGDAEWQLWEGEKLIATLARAAYEFSVEWGKLIFAWWTDDSSQSRRVTSYEIAEAELHIKATRGMGRETVTFTLRDPLRWRANKPEELAVTERRANFSALLPQLIAEHFADVKIQRINTRSKFSQANPSQYVRLLLKRKKETIAVIGCNEAEAQTDIDNTITPGLTWYAELKTPAQKLWLCVPNDRSQTLLERLTLLDTSHLNLSIECFDLNEAERAMIARRPVSQAELISLHPRGLIWPETKLPVRSRWRDRIVNLAPDLIEVREDTNQNFESYKLYGLEFARTKGETRDRVLFGVPNYPDEIAAKFAFNVNAGRRSLTEETFPQLENIVREILTYRRADTPDARHPFYRLRAEAWLESLLHRDIRALDVTLDPRFVYSQVPAWIGDERSILDLLTINHEGRLVVIELKAAEDAQLPLQGLDYWLRVEQARVRGEFTRRGLFAGIELADAPPLLYLVAPRLRFHRSFSLVANCIAPDIEAYRIGLNTNWREGVKVRDMERL